MANVTETVTQKGTDMLSQTVAREVRAQLGAQSISRKAFAEAVGIPYKRALALVDGQREWVLEDVGAAAAFLDVDALALIFPESAKTSGKVESSAA